MKKEKKLKPKKEIKKKFSDAIEARIQEKADHIAALELDYEQYETGAARVRFQQALQLQDIIGKKLYGEGAVEEIAKRAKVGASLLYKWHGVAKLYKFDLKEFDAKCKQLRGDGVLPSTRYFMGFLPKGKEELLDSVERGAKAMEQLNEGRHADDEDTIGVTGKFTDEVVEGVDLLKNRTKPGIRQGKRFECPHYVKWIKSQPSAIRGGTGQIDPHHLIMKARGASASDIYAIPLSRSLHDEYHKIGHILMEQKYEINFHTLLEDTLQSYIEHSKVDLPDLDVE